jgi:hypothetical protein
MNKRAFVEISSSSFSSTEELEEEEITEGVSSSSSSSSILNKEDGDVVEEQEEEKSKDINEKFEFYSGKTVEEIFESLIEQKERSDLEMLNKFTSFEEGSTEKQLKNVLPTMKIAENSAHPNSLLAMVEQNNSIAGYEIVSLMVGNVLKRDPNCPPFALSTVERITGNTGGSIEWE